MPAYAFCTSLPHRSEQEHLHVQEKRAAWIVDLGSVPAGFLLAFPIDGWMHVLEAAIALDAQGKGIGRQLFAAFHLCPLKWIML